jgi:RNA methyltransferase, TrmH family
MFVVEGVLNVAAALAAGAPVEAIFVACDAASTVAELAIGPIPVYELAPGVMERIADTVTPQPVAAIVRFLDTSLSDLRDSSFVVICVDVRDPGNGGTVIRTAEAAGADGVVCTEGSVDVYNPKTVRASAGSLFQVPIVTGGDPVSVVRQFGDWGLNTIGAVAHGGEDPADLDLTQPTALVLGNEASGLGRAVEDAVKVRTTIPLQGRAESLNVGMAAAVLGFEVARQRRAGRAR